MDRSTNILKKFAFFSVFCALIVMSFAFHSILTLSRQVNSFEDSTLPSVQLSYSAIRTLTEIEIQMNETNHSGLEMNRLYSVLLEALNQLSELVSEDQTFKFDFFQSSDYLNFKEELASTPGQISLQSFVAVKTELQFLIDLKQEHLQRAIDQSSQASFIALILIAIGLFSIFILMAYSFRKLSQNELQLKQTQETLEKERLATIQSSKLAALGEMVAGVAHEINNPLAVILGRAELLKRKLQKADVEKAFVIEVLSKIEEMAERISKIIVSMRRMSRDNPDGDHGVINLKALLDDVVNIATDRLKAHAIEFDVEIDDGVLEFDGNYTNLSQVIINLLNNSIDAVCEQTEKRILVSCIAHDHEIHLSIRDNGPGIKPEAREKMFDPFFTTKEIGKGTGLGLSISRNLIEKMNGRISSLDVAQGACFQIVLPKLKPNS